MRLILLATLCATASASLFSSKPDLDIKGSFADNAFNHVYNGRSNKLTLLLTNHASEELTVKYISGAFREIGGKEKYLKNTTAAKYAIKLPPSPNNAPVPVIYTFHSEYKPQELNLNVWVDYTDSASKTHREVGYEGQVTIVEPPGSWFDPALLFAYVILSGIVLLISLIVYNTYFANKKSKLSFLPFGKGKTPGRPIAPTKVTDAKNTPDTPAKAYEDEWIPKHHLRSADKPKKSATSDAEASATDGYSSAGGTRKRNVSAKSKKAR